MNATCYTANQKRLERVEREYSLKRIKLRSFLVHWNNPERIKNYKDSSGLVIHYTPNLRPHDAGTLTVGQINFNIPPNKEHHTVRAFCDHECSSILLTSPIYLIESRNHMHYLGM
ncbi:hypothetical protein KUTeg_018193 [Tegillarca granosa]|uniref:Copper type II ascorbate-dependent monooxygenase C-terminal domain-containing protein n=1 Tax=Tegillarca granosa TaxID=220873 RepID=A0ABQ9EHC7_TEGGR|nr:hypothetical protein KUTeg_018193 [Tegillarca granosa]